MSVSFSSLTALSGELIADVKTPKKRYNRNRRLSAQAPYWQIELSTGAEDYATGMATGAYLDSLLGPYTCFTLANPFPALQSHSGLTVLNTTGAGVTTITLTGFTANDPAPGAPGDFINFANHPKAYKVVSTAPANASGQATLTFTPPLHIGVTATEAVLYGAAATFKVCLDKVNTIELKGASRELVHEVTLVEQA